MHCGKLGPEPDAQAEEPDAQAEEIAAAMERLAETAAIGARLDARMALADDREDLARIRR